MADEQTTGNSLRLIKCKSCGSILQLTDEEMEQVYNLGLYYIDFMRPCCIEPDYHWMED